MLWKAGYGGWESKNVRLWMSPTWGVIPDVHLQHKEGKNVGKIKVCKME